jgi:Thermophilic metalloprotease (M29)
VGLFPSSTWHAAAFTTVDGLRHFPNIPSEEMFTTPDPARVDGHVTATRPLELFGALIDGIRVEFSEGRAVRLDAELSADHPAVARGEGRGRVRLGELARVDGEGRIRPLETTFYETLLDENAASHIALGSSTDYEPHPVGTPGLVWDAPGRHANYPSTIQPESEQRRRTGLRPVGRGGLGAVEALVDRSARANERLPVIPGDELRVGEHEIGVELECQLSGVDVGIEQALGLCVPDRVLEHPGPFADDGQRQVPHGPRARVKLGCDGREEASAGEHGNLDVAQEAVGQHPDALEPVRRARGGLDDELVEDRARRLDGRDLELLLRAEVREQAALAHSDLIREPAEREAFEALHRREARGLLEDRAARPDAVAPLCPRGPSCRVRIHP